MQLTSVFAQGTEPAHEPAIDPIVFGLIAFALLGVLIVAVLMFGKGRPHS
ncbi:MAG: hypothetical protein ACRDOJ_04355 [Nocardioidaceae bacterium]